MAKRPLKLLLLLPLLLLTPLLLHLQLQPLLLPKQLQPLLLLKQLLLPQLLQLPTLHLLPSNPRHQNKKADASRLFYCSKQRVHSATIFLFTVTSPHTSQRPFIQE